MTQSLDTRLRDTVTHLSTIAPPDLFAVFSAEQERLAAQEVPPTQVAVGDVLAPVTLTDPTGADVALPQGPSVIVFYRGAWCPYCNVALNAYQREVLPVARERGVTLVAVSPQGPAGSLSVTETNDLQFPVLTDTGSALARRLGLVFELTDDVREAQLAFGNDFASINDGGEWALPKPAVLVVDTGGVVRFVDVRPDYTQRTEPSAVVAALRALT